MAISFSVLMSRMNPGSRSYSEFLLELQQGHGDVPPKGDVRHGGITTLVKLAVEEPSCDDSYVQTIAGKVPPLFLAPQSRSIASEEAVHHIYSAPALIVFSDQLWLRNVHLFV